MFRQFFFCWLWQNVDGFRQQFWFSKRIEAEKLLTTNWAKTKILFVLIELKSIVFFMEKQFPTERKENLTEPILGIVRSLVFLRLIVFYWKWRNTSIDLEKYFTTFVEILFLCSQRIDSQTWNWNIVSASSFPEKEFTA